MKPETLRLSINPDFCNKDCLSGRMEIGFEPYEVTIEELHEAVSFGWAFSYQFKDGHRRTDNFLATDILAVDVDGGLTIDECLDLAVVRTYASLLYTTPSHDDDNHRYRVVFALPRTLTDPQELRFAARSLARRLGGDQAATDPARLFFGSVGCDAQILGSQISTDFLDELIEDGRLPVSELVEAKQRISTASRSTSRISPDTPVELPDGTLVSIGTITGKQPVHCPMHPDRNPSAFVSLAQNGHYLYCSSCRKTWFTSDADASDHGFDSFAKEVKRIKTEGIQTLQEEQTGLEPFLGETTLTPKNIIVQNQRYLKDGHIMIEIDEPGVTLIKSPKGSGKTTMLASILSKVTHSYASLEEAEQNDDILSPKPFYTNERVLLIGHRQALIGELCGRLGLNCYLDFTSVRNPGRLAEAKKRFGVCLDSVWRVADDKYDVVVIDEVEQVLAHFFSETMSSRRNRAFEILIQLLRKARHVIALDADLGWTTFNTIRAIQTMGAPHKPLPIKVVVNEAQIKDREILLYETDKQLMKALENAVVDGKRVFVSSNSRRKINDISNFLKTTAKALQLDLQILSITSENSKTEAAQRFIKNIKEEILNYQVVLSSPSLGTGVDITFPEDGQEIDAVFGFFETGITDHFDIDQQLARVRNPAEVHVWVSPRRYNFETEFEVILEDLLRSDLASNVRFGFEQQQRSTALDVDPFLTMAALVKQKRRASINNLRANFVKHKEDQGWTVTKIEKDRSMIKEGAQALELGRAISDDEYVDRLMEADVLNEVQYTRISRLLEVDNQAITRNEVFAYRRTSMELFYRQEITPSLIEADRQGRFRGEVRLFERLLEFSNTPDDLKVGLSTQGDPRIWSSRLSAEQRRAWQVALLDEVLSVTPVWSKGKFLADVVYSIEDLDPFLQKVREHKRSFEGQFELSTRKDVDRKVIQHLGSILGLVGLRQASAGSQKQGKRKIYQYHLDPTRLAFVEGLVAARSEVSPWTSLNQRLGFKYSDEEIDWLLSRS